MKRKQRANSARAGQPQRTRVALIKPSLAGLAAGGLTVGTKGQCNGEATTKVAVFDARNEPKGYAAGIR